MRSITAGRNNPRPRGRGLVQRKTRAKRVWQAEVHVGAERDLRAHNALGRGWFQAEAEIFGGSLRRPGERAAARAHPSLTVPARSRSGQHGCGELTAKHVEGWTWIGAPPARPAP